MTDVDPLCGYSWTSSEDGLLYTVLGKWSLNGQYMLCSVGPNDTAIRLRHLIEMRRAAELRDAQDGNSPGNLRSASIPLVSPAPSAVPAIPHEQRNPPDRS